MLLRTVVNERVVVAPKKLVNFFTFPQTFILIKSIWANITKYNHSRLWSDRWLSGKYINFCASLRVITISCIICVLWFSWNQWVATEKLFNSRENFSPISPEMSCWLWSWKIFYVLFQFLIQLCIQIPFYKFFFRNICRSLDRHLPSKLSIGFLTIAWVLINTSHFYWNSVSV